MQSLLVIIDLWSSEQEQVAQLCRESAQRMIGDFKGVRHFEAKFYVEELTSPILHQYLLTDI